MSHEPTPRASTVTRLDALIVAERDGPPLDLAVVFPNDEASMLAAVRAHTEGLARCTLYGDGPRIASLAAQIPEATQCRVVDTGSDGDHAARTAVAAVAAGHHDSILKGALRTHELIEAVLDKKQGLRTKQRLTHTFVFDIAGRRELFALTDAAINVAPSLPVAQASVQNALNVLGVLGLARAKIAILAASETVRPSVPATIFAQQLKELLCESTWARDHRSTLLNNGLIEASPQLNGDLRSSADIESIDGPLSLDAATSPRAATDKGIAGDVAGVADLLVAPSLEAGTVLYKALIHFARAQCAGVVHGATVPIALVSRADSVFSRVASVALVKRMLRLNAFKN